VTACRAEIDDQVDPAVMEKAFEVFFKYVQCLK
jgi:hypothetical protein